MKRKTKKIQCVDKAAPSIVSDINKLVVNYVVRDWCCIKVSNHLLDRLRQSLAHFPESKIVSSYNLKELIHAYTADKLMRFMLSVDANSPRNVLRSLGYSLN